MSSSEFHFPCCSNTFAAASLVAQTVRLWLETHSANAVDRIIFCVFLPEDERYYKEFLASHFPAKPEEDDETLVAATAGAVEVADAVLPKRLRVEDEGKDEKDDKDDDDEE